MTDRDEHLNGSKIVIRPEEDVRYLNPADSDIVENRLENSAD